LKSIEERINEELASEDEDDDDNDMDQVDGLDQRRADESADTPKSIENEKSNGNSGLNLKKVTISDEKKQKEISDKILTEFYNDRSIEQKSSHFQNANYAGQIASCLLTDIPNLPSVQHFSP